MTRLSALASVVSVLTVTALVVAAARGAPSISESPEITWDRVLPRGSGCWVDKPEPCGPNQWPIAHEPVVGPHNRLWMVGQGKGTPWVWWSADGLSWQRDSSDAGWNERYGMTITYFKGRLWAMGGTQVTNDAFRNEVWSSGDGHSWERILTRAPWTPRRWHAAVVFRDELWVLGGSDGEDRNDVWSTADGRTWVERRPAPWAPRGGHAALVHAGRLWILGGGGWDRALRDVWSTADGLEWRQELQRAPWPGRVHFGAKVLDDRLWIVGGATLNDVWFSHNGIQWQQAPTPPWSPRTTNASVAFDGALWLFGGKTGTSETVADEVWRMRPTD